MPDFGFPIAFLRLSKNAVGVILKKFEKLSKKGLTFQAKHDIIYESLRDTAKR